jgi:hypothetical protein
MAFQTSGEMNPRKVLLFSGHMIDGPNRKESRFPADKEPIAAKAIGDLLDQIAVERGDLAICGGACGGDLLFAEAALARGLSIAIYLPFEEDRFLAESVDFADADWRSRYFAAKSQAAFHIASEELGPLKADGNPFERNNEWMLQVATGYGCACRKLNPGILVMQSAQGWATKNVPGAIDGARDRCIFLQG